MSSAARKTHQDLPQDLILDIFKRLPIKPLLRLNCLSKTWHHLLVSPAFTTLHLYHHNMNNQQQHFLHSCSHDHKNRDSVFLISKDTVTRIPLPAPLPHCVEIVGSSNGLYCVRVSPRCFIIWNPATKQTFRDVPRLPRKFRSRKKTHLGFSFLPSTGHYKLVAIVFDHDGGFATVMFFTLGGGPANCWRKKRVEINVGPRNIDMTAKSKCVLANGCLYWDESMYATTLLSFDMGEEKFRLVGLPHDQSPAGKFTSTAAAAALTVEDGSLALIADGGPGDHLGRYHHLFIMNSREFSWFKHSTIIGLVMLVTGVPLSLYFHDKYILRAAANIDYPLSSTKCYLYNCHLCVLSIDHIRYCHYTHFSPYVESLVNPNVQEKSFQ